MTNYTVKSFRDRVQEKLELICNIKHPESYCYITYNHKFDFLGVSVNPVQDKDETSVCIGANICYTLDKYVQYLQLKN